MRDWFDYPGNSLQIYDPYYYERIHYKVWRDDVSPATSLIDDQFTILFHIKPSTRTSRQTIFMFGEGYESMELYLSSRDRMFFK